MATPQERLEAYYFWKGAYELRHDGLSKARERAKESPTAIGYGRHYTDADMDALYADKLLERVAKGEVLRSVSYMGQEEYVDVCGVESLFAKNDTLRLTINLKGDVDSILQEVRAYVEFHQKYESASCGYDDAFYRAMDKAEYIRAFHKIHFKVESQTIRVLGLWLYDKLNEENAFPSLAKALEYLEDLELDGVNILESLGKSAPLDEGEMKRALRFTRKSIEENEVRPLK